MRIALHHPADILLGQRMQDARKQAGLSQKALAQALQVNVQQLQSYETGEKRLQATKLYRCAQILNTPISDFFTGMETIPDHETQPRTSTLNMTRNTALSLLLVEDNPADEYLVREAITNSGIEVDIHHENNGDKALQYLEAQSSQKSFGPLPNIILLDLNLPKISGFDVLSQLKANHELRHIPVIVLSNSINVEDMQLSYELYASGFVAKAFDMDVFNQQISHLLHYWSYAVVLPSMQA